MDFQNLKTRLSEFESEINRMQGEYDYIKKEYTTSIERIEVLTKLNNITLKAIEVLSKVQEVTRDKVKNEFEQLVTFCLQFIFEEPYQFKLDFDKRGNLQNLNFKIEKPGYEESYDLIDTSGGGVINIISFALRIILMEVSSPKTQGLFLADEPFANLSENYHERASLLLEELSKKLNRQFIIISHESILKENLNFNQIEVK